MEVLDLRFNDVGDAGAAALASALERSTTMKTLDLFQTDVSDSGVVALASGLGRSPSMTTLDLSWNQITDVCVSTLALALATSRSMTVKTRSIPSESGPLSKTRGWKMARTPSLPSALTWQRCTNKSSACLIA